MRIEITSSNQFEQMVIHGHTQFIVVSPNDLVASFHIHGRLSFLEWLDNNVIEEYNGKGYRYFCTDYESAHQLMKEELNGISNKNL